MATSLTNNVSNPPSSSSSAAATAATSPFPSPSLASQPHPARFTPIHPPQSISVTSLGLTEEDSSSVNGAKDGVVDEKKDDSSVAPAPWKPRNVSSYKRSEKLMLIGEGTYGSVFLARDPNGELVALKKIRKEKKEGFPITAIREIKILKRVDHVNIVRLKDVVSSHNYIETPSTSNNNNINTNTTHTPSSTAPLRSVFKEGEVFMVFEFCDHDLTGLLESKVNMSDAQVKYYMKCILEGLYYLHKTKIIHRDIKGANILISNNGAVKLADFGLARLQTKASGKGKEHYTNRVVTLWYRAPELLLGMTDYNGAVDMWALGCLFAELLTRGMVLFPGNNTDLDQLNRIYEYCGTPNETNWPGVTKLRYYQQFTPKPRERTLTRLFTSKHSLPHPPTPAAIDLLDKLLTLDPSQRLTAHQALDHDYFFEPPLPMIKADHPKYQQNYHEYHSKRRRKNREQQEAAAIAAGGGGTTSQTLNPPSSMEGSRGTTNQFVHKQPHRPLPTNQSSQPTQHSNTSSIQQRSNSSSSSSFAPVAPNQTGGGGPVTNSNHPHHSHSSGGIGSNTGPAGFHQQKQSGGGGGGGAHHPYQPKR